MIRITSLSAALLYGHGPVRRETVLRARVGERAGRSPGGIVERTRRRPARPSFNLSAS